VAPAVRKHPGAWPNLYERSDVGQRTREPEHQSAPLSAEVNRLVELVVGSGALSLQSSPRFRDLVERFAAFGSAGHGLLSLAEATPAIAAEFVIARAGSVPTAVATQHLRRSSLRLLFRFARVLRIADHDPTLDLRLPPRSNLHCRALTDDEIAVCRSFALWSLTNTRRPAAWALAEATARTAELPHISVGDLDLDNRRVWIHCSTRTVPRWGALSEWGALQLERRVAELRDRGADHSTLLIYEGGGSPESRQASSCMAISDTLVAAGLAGERDVRPLSVAAWAGTHVFADTGQIEAAAVALGVRSLDRAARMIGWDWRGSEERR
jgi:integrase/recombinase XerC